MAAVNFIALLRCVPRGGLSDGIQKVSTPSLLDDPTLMKHRCFYSFSLEDDR